MFSLYANAIANTPSVKEGAFAERIAIRRVLSRIVIYLGRVSQHASSSLPCLRLHRVGFAPTMHYCTVACALTARFHPYLFTKRRYVSVALFAVLAGMKDARVRSTFIIPRSGPWDHSRQALPATRFLIFLIKGTQGCPDVPLRF